MVRTQIQLTDEQSRFLKTIANDEGVSMAEIIRRSIELYLRSRIRPAHSQQKQKAISIIGIASSNTPDLGVNHDDYLADVFGANQS